MLSDMGLGSRIRGLSGSGLSKQRGTLVFGLGDFGLWSSVFDQSNEPPSSTTQRPKTQNLRPKTLALISEVKNAVLRKTSCFLCRATLRFDDQASQGRTSSIRLKRSRDPCCLCRDDGQRQDRPRHGPT